MRESLLEAVADLPVTVLGPRGVLVSGGDRTDRLYVLKSGDLEVLRGGSVVASFGQPGDIIGEMSVLLEKPHSATVRSRLGAEVHVVDDPISFLDAHPAVSRQLARSLAQRLDRTTALLIDLRAQMKERQDRDLADKILALLK
jgi:CRP-like cAMP-binding protein